MSGRAIHPTPTPDFRAVFEAVPGLYLVLTPGLTIVGASDAYLAATLTRRGDILGRSLFDVFPDNPDDPRASGVSNLRASLERVLAGRRSDAMAVQKYDIRRPESEGGGFEERYWSPVNSPVFGPDGEVAWILHCVEDVTEFIRLRQEGEESHRLTQELRSRTGSMEAEIYRRAQEIQAVNHQLLDLHESLEARVHERTAELEQANERLRSEIAERARADQARRDSEIRYRLLFESNPHPMWVYDRATLRFLAVNEAAERLYGWTAEEFLGMTIADIRPHADVAKLHEELARDRGALVESREWRHCRKDGTVFTVEVASHLVRFADRDAALVLAMDVTRRRELEDQLRQAQKMEAIGLLAGGVAHDFNNLLTAILGYGELLHQRLAGDAESRAEVDEVIHAAQRAANLTRQLLAFSRQQVLEPRVLDLNAIVSDLDRMIRRLIGEDIELLTATAPRLGRVRIDPGQIEQVLMNLVVNARDAMPEGGKMTIETANVELDAGAARGRVELPPGHYVLLAVSDTGCGMSPETVARIFEPFFTTKEVGRGTGLGLSTVHGIVRQSAGHIEVYSEPGCGTTFKIYLPRVEVAGESIGAAAPEPMHFAGSESVLLVEDEEIIRRVVVHSLERLGYRVIAVRDPAQALAICARPEQAIDLLVTDVIMPQMNGPQLVREVLALRPGLPVLFVSGYTDRALVHHGQRDEGTEFLQKPFTPEGLARKLREMLDRRRPRVH